MSYQISTGRWGGSLIGCKREAHCPTPNRLSFSGSSSRHLRAWPSLSSTNPSDTRHATLVPSLPASQKARAGPYDANAEENLWERVQLLQRLLDVSIAEEDYSKAKQVHAQLSGLRAQLSEYEQLLLLKIGCLAKGSINERLKLITDLGELGDKRVLPVLVHGLSDSNSLVASETEKAMWKVFMRSGRADVDQRMEEGLAFMLANDLPRALDVFSEIIKMAPSFAEGWNKRATVNYFLQEYRASISDCEQVLELNPYHFGALSGMGLCYAALNEPESALIWFEKAYVMHPGLGQISKFITMLKQKQADSKKEEDTDKP